MSRTVVGQWSTGSYRRVCRVDGVIAIFPRSQCSYRIRSSLRWNGMGQHTMVLDCVVPVMCGGRHNRKHKIEWCDGECHEWLCVYMRGTFAREYW